MDVEELQNQILLAMNGAKQAFGADASACLQWQLHCVREALGSKCSQASDMEAAIMSDSAADTELDSVSDSEQALDATIPLAALMGIGSLFYSGARTIFDANGLFSIGTDK